MAKGYSFVDITTPSSPTATPVAGGTLVDGTTYYYRVIGVRAVSNNNWCGKSKSSVEFSATADSTNKSMEISFTMPVGEAISYRIFRSTAAGEMLTTIDTTGTPPKCIAFYPTDATYNSGGTVTFTDTGYGFGGNNYLEIENDPHGVLTLSGSTESDPFSIVDLYNEDVSQGWGVITRLDTNTYKANCYIVGHSNMYWEDRAKTIIFADGYDFYNNSSNFTFGRIIGESQTIEGCDIIITSSWLGSSTVTSIYAYRTNFTYKYPGLGCSGLGLAGGGFSSGLLQDCQIDRFRNFAPYGGSNCTFKNVIMSQFDNAFSYFAANYDDVKMLNGSRVWQLNGSKTTEAKGVYTEGTNACLWIGDDNELTLIDSVVPEDAGVAFAGVDNSYMYDKFSFNLNVVDIDGDPVETANVTIYDKDGAAIVETTTDASGDITEQIITRVSYYIDDAVEFPPDNRSPYTIVISKTGYGTYKEIVDYTETNPIVKTITLPRAGFETKIYDSTLIDSTIY